jgi:hypothetical protein
MSESHWDPEKFRAEITDEKIIEAIMCYMPTAAYKGPPMPTTICIEEAIKRIQAYRDLRAAARAVVESIKAPIFEYTDWNAKIQSAIAALAAALGEGRGTKEE